MSTSKRRCVELIAFDKDHNLEYQGKCKLTINALSKLLCVEPKNEEFKMKSALFTWKFLAKKNILFVFAEHDFMDFALILASEKLCTKVNDLIMELKEETDIVTEELLHERFLIPIFNKFSDKKFIMIKKIMTYWISINNRIQKMKYLQLMKECNGEQNVNSKNASGRKRRHHETGNDEETVNVKQETSAPSKKKKAAEYDKIIPSSQFKMVTVKVKCGIQRRLLIFTSTDMTECYEYTCQNQIYFCRGCHPKRITAILEYDDEKKEEFIKLDKKLHTCIPIPYEPQNYSEIKIIQKPGYEFLENCSTQSGRALFVFNPDDRNSCYEYFWRKLECKFYCHGCYLKKKTTTAEICNENQENEYIRMLHTDHVCEYTSYQPDKYTQFKDIVLKPNFEIQTKAKGGRKTLIIFDKHDKSLCYNYFFSNSKKRYVCAECHGKSKTVSAKLCQNSEGEEYIILSNAQHSCTLRKYVSQSVITIHSAQIKVESNKNNIIIFASDDQKQCYIFSSASKNNNNKKYICYGCQNVLHSKKRRNKATENLRTAVYCYLSKEENSLEESVQMPPHQKHLCQPQKYDSTSVLTIQLNNKTTKISNTNQKPQQKKRKVADEKNIIRFPNFELQRSVSGLKDGKLVIFKDDDRSLCYNYFYCKTNDAYFCGKCRHKNIHLKAYLHIDEKTGEKYIALGKNEHVCELTKYEPEKKDIEDSNFMVFNRGNGSIKLVVFTSSTKEFCYEFTWRKSKKFFSCHACEMLKTYVTTKIVKNENGKEFVQRFKNDHVCKPKKFVLEEFQPKTVPKSEFIICSNAKGKPNSKLIVFDEKRNGFCYEYVLKGGRNIFVCNKCSNDKKKKQHTSAKLNHNGEYVELSPLQHICESTKFDAQKYERNKVDSNFVLLHKISGEPSSKLMVFDSEKTNFGYEYLNESDDKYYCFQCRFSKPGKYITAKLLTDENGNHLIETKKNEHVCKIKNLREMKRIVEADEFEMEENGKIITVKHPTDNNEFYQFSFDEQINAWPTGRYFSKPNFPKIIGRPRPRFFWNLHCYNKRFEYCYETFVALSLKNPDSLFHFSKQKIDLQMSLPLLFHLHLFQNFDSQKFWNSDPESLALKHLKIFFINTYLIIAVTLQNYIIIELY